VASMAPRTILIANPGTKRCETYLQEQARFWATRGREANVVVVPWAEIVPRDGNLDDLALFDQPALVRLESPGKDDGVTRHLLNAGSRDDPGEPRRDWSDVPLSKGMLVRPGLVDRGFRRVLRGLRDSFDCRPHLKPSACSLAIAEMFDKRATCKKLESLGIPIPATLYHYSDAEMEEALFSNLFSWPTTYLKLNSGSSATGIVTLYLNEDRYFTRGLSTLAPTEEGFFNTRLLQALEGEPLHQVMRFIAREGCLIQEGIPMARIDEQNFDLRVVCLNGEPVASLFRLSRHPMTNLHLGGRRGDYDYCRSHIPQRLWLDALDYCRETAQCFDSTIVGVDLVFERTLRHCFILEANAFGDFFPGWFNPEGKSLHQLQIEADLRRL
jgi:hypothetical protein